MDAPLGNKHPAETAWQAVGAFANQLFDNRFGAIGFLHGKDKLDYI
jgi:hypothetical protein